MLGRTDSRRRLLFLLLVFGVGSLALVTRTAYWQVLRGTSSTAWAADQTSVRIEIGGRRGDIYDRSGTVLLATSVARDRLVAAADQLSPTSRRGPPTPWSGSWRSTRPGTPTCATKLASDKPYVILARGITPEMAERIRQAGNARQVVGLSLEPEPERVYPQEGGGPGSTLAAHLLGFVNRDNVGQYGVEQFYQEELAGSPRVLLAQRDASGRARSDTSVVQEPGTLGEDLRLTIDAGLQLALEQELLAAWIADDAKSVSAVVIDPYTGEIYAMATYPAYDANDYRAVAATTPGRFIDPVVSNVYEPGSVFKMMTATTALEAGTVTRTTKIKDVGTLRLDGGRTKIDNADRQGMGWITFEDGIAYSRNVVAAKVALGLDDSDRGLLGDAVRHLAQARLRREDRHRCRRRGRRHRARPSRPTMARDRPRERRLRPGRGRHADPARDGVRDDRQRRDDGQPHVVQAVGAREIGRRRAAGSWTPRSPRRSGGLMDHVVEEVPFYRDRTLVPGYHVGGKTGTAQIWDAKANEGRGGWKHNLFNYSFVGYIGREKDVPDLVVAVRIEEGTPNDRPSRPAGDARHVVRAVPAHRDRRDHDPRPADRPTADGLGR